MSAPQPARLGRAWVRWYQRALPAYWLSLFFLTHLPKLEVRVGFRASDKAAHVVAFALLAFLFWRFAETLRSPLSGWFVWRALAILLAYAAVDEYLQQFVGRSTDPLDALCNFAGIVLALALLEYRRRARRDIATEAPQR